MSDPTAWLDRSDAQCWQCGAPADGKSAYVMSLVADLPPAGRIRTPGHPRHTAGQGEGPRAALPNLPLSKPRIGDHDIRLRCRGRADCSVRAIRVLAAVRHPGLGPGQSRRDLKHDGCGGWRCGTCSRYGGGRSASAAFRLSIAGHLSAGDFLAAGRLALPDIGLRRGSGHRPRRKLACSPRRGPSGFRHNIGAACDRVGKCSAFRHAAFRHAANRHAAFRHAANRDVAGCRAK